MSAVIVGNRVEILPGERTFDLMSNTCEYFMIGEKGDDLWLEGEQIGPDSEFLFNGRLFCKAGGEGSVIDNFPKGDVPQGWTKQQNVQNEGYSLLDSDGEVIFGYTVVGDVCHVTVGLYRKDGKAAAWAGQGGLVVEGVTAKIGRKGLLFR